jgi:hypothetical protein|tara:strand:+ start:242 stop:475 length:234 start_codon:yes stop_codon:yes gene_type:complete
MQKIFNAIAVASGVLSLTVVGAGLTVYLNKDAIINNIKEKALESVTGGLGDVIEDALPIPNMTGDVIPKQTLPMKPF